jgi:hypothetical protein
MLNVLYGSQNRQRSLLYTSLTGWFLKQYWKVFTARYGLIPYKSRLRVVLRSALTPYLCVLYECQQTLQAFEDGPDRGFRNVGQYKTDAGETPKS